MQNILNSNLTKSIIVIIGMLFIYFLINYIFKKVITKTFGDKKILVKSNKQKTYFTLINSIIKYFLLIIVFLTILDINGINISSLITGLGIVGIVVGLAVQDALKDIIMGKNIMSGHFFEVGDVIKYNDIIGKVISIELKFTKIRDIYTNNIISITNRNIDKVIKFSDWLDIDVPIPYECEVEPTKDILVGITEKMKSINNVKDTEFLGINEFESSSIIYKIRIYCMPEYRPIINRSALELIKKELDKEKISIPYNHICIENINK